MKGLRVVAPQHNLALVEMAPLIYLALYFATIDNCNTIHPVSASHNTPTPPSLGDIAILARATPACKASMYQREVSIYSVTYPDHPDYTLRLHYLYASRTVKPF
jgi:hypothetical protein